MKLVVQVGTKIDGNIAHCKIWNLYPIVFGSTKNIESKVHTYYDNMLRFTNESRKIEWNQNKPKFWTNLITSALEGDNPDNPSALERNMPKY